MPHDPLGMRFVYSSSAPLYPLVLMGQPHLKCLYAILDVEFADLCIPITFPRETGETSRQCLLYQIPADCFVSRCKLNN
ncbi:hypothetical protein OUZ56_027065 [Daphnia magna]|uniref:Uncharacterized protein n=1 Tax=Daphnia magna TaxID=35525 RepID=A0ABQ9ZNZ3_9CRUS|nr:hypothetical protein OUZ56_027065 [Daphnia magna]